MNMVKINIEFYFPAIVELVGDLPLDWNHIDNLFSTEIKERISKANGLPMPIEATIYDIIVEVKRETNQQ